MQLTIRVIAAVIVFLWVLFIFLVPVDAADCYLDALRLENCRDNSVLCRPVVEFTAEAEGYYNVNFSDGSGEQVYLLASEVYYVHVPAQVEQVYFWFNGSMVALVNVDYGNCDNSPDNEPPDDRLNWQEGDSFFLVSVENGLVNVYFTGSGAGELILQTATAACSEDGSACFDGASVVTLIDPEGKTYYVTVSLAD